MDIQPRRAGGPRRAPLDRRAFLQRAALAGIGAPALVALLDACASSSVIGPGDVVPSGTQSGGSGLVVASPDNPVTWPLSPDNPAIAEDLEPEQGGVLQLYNYADYLAPGLIKAFKKKYESTTSKGSSRRSTTPRRRSPRSVRATSRTTSTSRATTRSARWSLGSSSDR